jgi:hypothetical protein
MIFTDADLKMLAQKLQAASAAEAERPVKTFSEAIQAASRAGDGRKLELLRYVNAIARRVGVKLPMDETIDLYWLNKQLVGEDIDARISFKKALTAAGLLA